MEPEMFYRLLPLMENLLYNLAHTSLKKIHFKDTPNLIATMYGFHCCRDAKFNHLAPIL
jgi:hypothetical protein